ncbi:MAG: DUF1211 domain-containing protein [Candidatus Eremiobacteraeota bacterium]|nr:DUF1211 domain-containing protein [Candidatus Eremiobacteraeota bacterium]MBV9647861.1 DUF1211 domain-containing protein [Candidatus Eremiobacteraeota bacterium]
MNKARFEAFSDGVFAFAITLLILSIALPPFRHAPTQAELTHALLALWPNALAYGLSFAVIGIMWQNHHALFRLIARVDRMTVFLNLGLLGMTVFIPFATSTLGSYITMKPATFLYGLTLTGCATMYNAMLAHLVRSHAFSSHVPPASIQQTVVAYRTGWITYAAAMVVALLLPVVSVCLYLIIAAYYLVPRGVDTDLALPAEGAETSHLRAG